MAPTMAHQAIVSWPHFRENATVCWSFQAPPPDLAANHQFALRGTCENWRTASGPDINFYNLGKKVINSTLFHSLLAAGLKFDSENRYLYTPNETRFQRLNFSTPYGPSWIKPVGIRSFWTSKGRASVRYHLSPSVTAWLDFGGRDVACVRTRLYLTELDGTPIKPSLMQSRRKIICRSWWNYQWFIRIFATLQLIASGEGDICIGSSSAEHLILQRFPMSLIADRMLQEANLKSEEQASEFVEEMQRSDGEATETLIDEEDSSGADAATT